MTILQIHGSMQNLIFGARLSSDIYFSRGFFDFMDINQVKLMTHEGDYKYSAFMDFK